MKAAKNSAAEIKAVPWENPLIPNKRLRQIYTSMAELRLLEDHFATRSRGKASSPSTGEEACRASTALSLLPGDLTSDPAPGIATSFLRGAKLEGIAAASVADKSQLPIPKDPSTRLHLAIGASLAAKKKGPIVLAYLYPGELVPREWKPIFRLAAAHAAPMIFVALPEPAKTSLNPGNLSKLSTAVGVPGIPVDSADAVALYRVVQESIVRARAGGGPVLMECISFQLPSRKSPPADPIRNMRESLLHRKAAEEAWFTAVASRFTARLKTAAL